MITQGVMVIRCTNVNEKITIQLEIEKEEVEAEVEREIEAIITDQVDKTMNKRIVTEMKEIEIKVVIETTIGNNLEMI